MQKLKNESCTTPSPITKTIVTTTLLIRDSRDRRADRWTDWRIKCVVTKDVCNCTKIHTITTRCCVDENGIGESFFVLWRVKV